MPNDVGLRNLGRKEAAVAVAVACLLLLVSWLASNFTGAKEGTELTASGASPDDAVLDIDISPVVSAADVQSCLVDSFATSPVDVKVRYSEIQKSERGDYPVLVLENRAGDLRLCDSFGGDRPSVAPLAYADAGKPVTFLSNGRQAWDCNGNTLAGFAVSQWLSVAPAVSRVQMRFVVNHSPGPWFSTEAQKGFAHLHAWLSDEGPGVDLQWQVRVLDSKGALVEQQAFSTEPQALTGCDAGTLDLG